MPVPIELHEVTLRYRGYTVLENLSLTVCEGETLAVLGPSGSGKTSVLRLTLGFVAPDCGAIRLNGRVVSDNGRILVAPERRNLAVVFQDLALWPHLTVWQNLEFVLRSRGVAAAERPSRIADMLARVDLTDRQGGYPGALSGGERQRVAIARALILEPAAILLDEPLSSLDVALKRDLLGQFRTLFNERRLAGIYVTHDLREAATLGDRIAVLENGRLVQVGTLDQIHRAPVSAFVRALVEDLAWSSNPRAIARETSRPSNPAPRDR